VLNRVAIHAALLALALLMTISGQAIAQQVTGAPDATTTIDGRFLPPQPFRGKLIRTDDVGFAAPSTFGGTRQGMAISWPARIKDKAGIRWQFIGKIDKLAVTM